MANANASNPSDRRYTSEHEWIKPDGDSYLVGITSFAQDQLGDIVYLELPDVGRRLEPEEPFGVVESVKAVSDLYAPVAGEVVAVNDDLTGRPELVNGDPYGDGWMLEVRVDGATGPATAGLLDASGYAATIA